MPWLCADPPCGLFLLIGCPRVLAPPTSSEFAFPASQQGPGSHVVAAAAVTFSPATKTFGNYLIRLQVAGKTLGSWVGSVL